MTNRLLLAILALCLAFLASACAASGPSGFEFQVSPGPYAVGLKVIHQYDDRRQAPPDDADKPSRDRRGRPLQTLIWYPAQKSDAATMTVGDYVALAATQFHFDTPDLHNRWATSLLSASRSVPLWAIRDATPVAGHFPVVIYSPSQSSVAWENADLCEYLASHGYVVVTSPSMGAKTFDSNDNLPDINAQAADILFLIDYAKTLPDADLSKLAVAGWSWGGMANLFAAARDPRIDVLVSLDGSMRYYPGLIKAAGDVHPERMRIPLLFFTEGEITLEELPYFYSQNPYFAGPSTLNAWTHGDLFTAHMLGMPHPGFSSMFQRRWSQQKFIDNQKADYDREDVDTSYAWVARYTLEFLDAYLKHDTEAQAFLRNTPAANGVPKHIMSVNFRAAKPDANP
jgi:Dienelactone hydrolase and related enzymes